MCVYNQKDKQVFKVACGKIWLWDIKECPNDNDKSAL